MCLFVCVSVALRVSCSSMRTLHVSVYKFGEGPRGSYGVVTSADMSSLSNPNWSTLAAATIVAAARTTTTTTAVAAAQLLSFHTCVPNDFPRPAGTALRKARSPKWHQRVEVLSLSQSRQRLVNLPLWRVTGRSGKWKFPPYSSQESPDNLPSELGSGKVTTLGRSSLLF